MNTLKSGTTIVVLLGVLYGVYIVLSKPERLRDLPLPGSTTAAKNDPGPSIEFAPDAHTGHAHAEPHLAVETSGPGGVGAQAGSPASPALPPPVAPLPGFAQDSTHGVPTADSPAGTTSPGYGASAYGASAYSASNAATAGVSSGSSGSLGGHAAGSGAPAGYGGGSRYNLSGGGNVGSSDSSGISTYADPRGGIAPASSQVPDGGYGAQAPVRPAYNETPNAPDSTPAVQSDALAEYSLRQMWAQAEQLVAENKLKEALALLSSHYSHPGMPEAQREAMTPWLDALAGRVIYSKEHLLAMPYEARAKETLFDIQERFNVPWQLLQNINADVVKDPQLVVAGTPLKVVQGPFRAEVELSTSQLTVYLNDLYAGRFPFSIGNEPPRPGAYKVQDKRLDRVYYGDGVTIPASDPTNPYGGVWLDLGSEMSIHGSSLQADGPRLGCISLSPQDAKDVYSILSLSSEVVVR